LRLSTFDLRPLLRFTFCVLLSAIGYGLSANGIAASAPSLSYAQAGAQAVVRLEVRPMKGFVVQKRSQVWVLNPFDGSELKLNLKGKAWAKEPELYLEKVDPLEWKLAVPKNAKTGEYPLQLAGIAYVCETTQGVCLRQEVSAKAVLKVGVKGQDVVGVLEVGEALQLGQP
jgi:hypothetical protein